MSQRSNFQEYLSGNISGIAEQMPARYAQPRHLFRRPVQTLLPVPLPHLPFASDTIDRYSSPLCTALRLYCRTRPWLTHHSSRRPHPALGYLLPTLASLAQSASETVPARDWLRRTSCRNTVSTGTWCPKHIGLLGRCGMQILRKRGMQILRKRGMQARRKGWFEILLLSCPVQLGFEIARGCRTSGSGMPTPDMCYLR